MCVLNDLPAESLHTSLQAETNCFTVSFCSVDKEDEMTCLIKGCNFVLRNIPHEAFVYAKHADSEFRFQTTQPDIFPYLLVNIGSGVSIVKVTHTLTTPFLPIFCQKGLF